MSFPREKNTQPQPEEHGCEWCDDTANHAVEIKKKVGRGVLGTGQFVFACHRHKETAQATARATS